MQNKKQIILSILAIFVLSVLVIGATFAYFQAQGDTSSQTSATVKTYTTDVFSFETGDAINFSLNQENFTSGKGNQTGSTFAKTILTANNKTNTATEHYYLYLNISNNTFLYTQNESTPELLLTITDASGNAVTDITSLTYKTVTDGKGASISGYDITNKSGVITLFNNKEITASPTKTDEWNITVTLVNYDKDQSVNTGKSFSAKLMIQKKADKQTLAEYVKSQYTGTQGENNIYYHTSTLTNGAGDNSYRYAGASDQVNNFVCFGSTETSCPTDNLYRIIGVFEDKVKLIKYDYATSALLRTDGDYSSSETPNASTYKGSLTSINIYSWNYKAANSASNEWSTSLLNKTNLNTNYLNNIGTTWSNLVEDATWKVSGHTTNSVTPSEMYTAEITNATKTYGPSDGTSKIGLMYVSDYGFAASPSAWTKTLYNYSGNDANGTSIKTINWMYMGYNEWTISRHFDNTNSAFFVNSTGNVLGSNVRSDNGVRPSFNLESSVKYVSGSGSMSDPVRVN